jgi:hypothetical protein
MNRLNKILVAAVAPVIGFMAQASSAAVVYNESTALPSGLPFYNNDNAKTPPNTVTLDNVLVRSSILPQGSWLEVTRVELKAVQSSNAPTSDVQLYYASIATDTVGPTPATITPPTAVSAVNGGVQNVSANGAGVAFKPIVFENPANPGTAPLFTLSAAEINYTDYDANHGEFVLGYKFTDTTGGLNPVQGAALAMPTSPDVQTVEYFNYDTGTNGQATFTFFGQGDPDDGAGIYMIISGNVLVPEPASLGVLAIGGMLLGRRPRRQA